DYPRRRADYHRLFRVQRRARFEIFGEVILQNHLLTILILLPVVGAATTIVYSFTTGAKESHHRWIAFGFTALAFLASLLLILGSAMVRVFVSVDLVLFFLFFGASLVPMFFLI